MSVPRDDLVMPGPTARLDQTMTRRAAAVMAAIADRTGRLSDLPDVLAALGLDVRVTKPTTAVTPAKANHEKKPPKPRPGQDHCIHGHPLYGDNLYVRTDGKRICRTCANRRRREAYAREKERLGIPDRHIAHDGVCANGHPLTPDNTSYRANGTPRCKTCVSQANRRYRLARTARKKGKAA